MHIQYYNNIFNPFLKKKEVFLLSESNFEDNKFGIKFALKTHEIVPNFLGVSPWIPQ